MDLLGLKPLEILHDEAFKEHTSPSWYLHGINLLHGEMSVEALVQASW